MKITEERQQLLDLVVRVPLDKIPIAKTILQAFIVDPALLALKTAAVNDEKLTPNTIK